MTISSHNTSTPLVSDPFLLELQADAKEIEAACANFLQAHAVISTDLLNSADTAQIDKIHETSEALLNLRRDSVATDTSEEVRSPLLPTRRLSRLSIDDSSKTLSTLEPLMKSVAQLDLVSSQFFPRTPLNTLETLISSATETHMLSQALVREINGSPIVVESKKVDSPKADLIPFVLPRAKIGFADDEKAVRRTLEKWLPEYAIGEIPFAVSGTETENTFLRSYGHIFDVLFLDNNMKPGKCGVELIVPIRANPEWSQMVVILLTGDDPGELEKKVDREKSDGSIESIPFWKHLGFDAYLHKPVSKKQIEACLIKTYQRLFYSSNPADERRWITNNRDSTAADLEKK